MKLESNHPIYVKAKEQGILKGQKLEFLNYLSLFGPCSAKELIAEVRKRELGDPLELNKLNRHPSVLKRLGLVKINSYRECKASVSTKKSKKVEILEIVETFTDLTKKPTGKTLKLIDSSKNAALLAVEIYNKPRTTFRTESYITLMINAWTKLLHAYIRNQHGEIYLYESEADGRKRTWDISQCIKEKVSVSDPIKANLLLFIRLRNEVEHDLVDEKVIDANFFGECQSLLYNYENFLTTHFGIEHALNATLAFSLQFSLMRDPSQQQAMKRTICNEAKEILNFLNNYRSSLPRETFESQEFSVKLIQVPRISNTNRNDLAINFVKYDDLSEEERREYDVVTSIVKKQVEKVAVANAGKLKPGKALVRINSEISFKMTHSDQNALTKMFKIRPYGKLREAQPERAQTTYCLYDQPNNSYLFTDEWVEFVVGLVKNHHFDKDKIRELDRAGAEMEVSNYLN